MPNYFFIFILVCGIAFASGLYSYRYLGKKYKFLIVFTAFAFCTEIVMSIATRTGYLKNTMPELHFYLMVEFFLLALFYRQQLNGFVKKNIIVIIIIIFELYLLLNALFISDLDDFPNITRSLEGLILVSFSIILFYKILIELKYENIWKIPLVWINFAVLFYFTGIFFHNILFNVILNYSRELSKMLHKYFALIDILFYLIISAAFLMARKFHSEKK